MFGLRKNTSSSSSPHWNSHKDISSQPPRFSQLVPASSLEPAIDGPPSPENIRAYTEQMKRSSFFNNTDRSTVSSSASSFYSSGSANTSTDLSRSSSKRSNASSMPTKSERPESIQIFGKAIFSRRTSRKSKRDTGSIRTSTFLSGYGSQFTAAPAKDHYYGTKGGSRSATMSDSLSSIEESKSRISKPFNFQHVVHTGREHNLELSQSESDLASNFSSIRSSQVPVVGNLKGIRADDLHFENFSSERLNITPEIESEEFDRPRTSPNKRNTLRKSQLPPPLPRLNHAKSHDGLRIAPPRPPRSPLDMTSPLPPPPRTSSRTTSMVWENHDPLASTTLERPETVNGFRKPKAFHLPNSPPRPITRSFEPEDLQMDFPSTPRTPANESWPLSASGTFDNTALADVPEEEEFFASSRRSRLSSSSLRYSKSVPDFARFDHDRFNEDRPMTPGGTNEIGVAISPSRGETVHLNQEAWEDDIDYCYEHEAEADCEYDWDRCSFDVARPEVNESPKPKIQRRSIPRSPLVPSHLDLPALSPSGMSLASPQPYTPGPGTQPVKRISHLRSPSYASSFKESHGFHLSPSLLIPGDFAAQMEVSIPHGVDLSGAEDTLYDEIFSGQNNPENYHPYHNSHRTEDMESSRSSEPVSSRSSALSKSASLESVVLLSRAANVALQMRSVSVGSSASLPELVHSRMSEPVIDLGQRPVKLIVEDVTTPTADVRPEEVQVAEEKKEKVAAPTSASRSRSASVVTPTTPHSRKASGGRKRAGSSSASYMLFPQI